MVILVGLDQSGGGRGYISGTRPKWGVDVVILVGLDQSGGGRGYISRTRPKWGWTWLY